MKLEALQADFQRIVLDPERVGADWVSRSARGLSSLHRLGIYHNAYRARLIDVLFDTFEHTAVYLGDEWFRQLASAYVQSNNSTERNIGLYGQGFPRYLAERLPADEEVSEHALLDWKLRRAFDGADCTVMTREHLQRLASGDLEAGRLRPVPTLSIITQAFNTLEIWHAIDQDGHPPVAERLPQPVNILIWRKGHSPHFRSLSDIESSAISCVCSGYTLDAIGEALAKDFPDADAATEFGVMLGRWIDDELLSIDG